MVLVMSNNSMSNVEEMMEFLFQRRARALPPHALAQVFDILSWSMDNGGQEILDARHKWLQSGNREKVEIILAMNDCYPCKTREEMVELFREITTRWPSLKDVCQAILEQWDRQMGS